MYLGHVISENGIQTDPKKVEAIWKWPIPTNVTEVHSFLGFTNYYHRFIKKYAQVAKPLYKLISGEHVARKSNLIKWEQNAKKPLTNLKELCTSTPILAYVDFGNHSSCIQLQAFSAFELSYTKNKMELKRLLVMPVNHYENWNKNIPSISWNFFA